MSREAVQVAELRCSCPRKMPKAARPTRKAEAWQQNPSFPRLVRTSAEERVPAALADASKARMLAQRFG
eukprot:CAMPEP_0195640538 /NCGR_PEP_ID=MMETSP0815-20121206/26205_1 /TAXON_ID=97485 /ORGANISM="Prymnesium parvum, Strain Texoma1" /LENGTH=68 /DNA_ID=CAMNT_0040783219 /DNA_START=28 /DNA_END=230 /DNA_ORIENTATION=+